MDYPKKTREPRHEATSFFLDQVVHFRTPYPRSLRDWPGGMGPLFFSTKSESKKEVVMDKYGNLDYKEIMAVLAKQRDARLAALAAKKAKKAKKVKKAKKMKSRIK